MLNIVPERKITHHFKPVRAINHEQDKIGDFCNINHGVEVVVAFEEGDPFLLSTNNRNGTLDMIEGLLGESSYQGLHERGLADARGADDGDDDGWWKVV